MKPHTLSFFAPAVAAALLAGCAASPSQPAPMAIQKCEALAGLSIPAASIGLPTRGAVIATAERAPEVAPYKDAEGEHLLPTPPRCVVLGRVLPVDPAAPPINFAINLPLVNWNGRDLLEACSESTWTCSLPPGRR